MRYLILKDGELQVAKERVALTHAELVDLGQRLVAHAVEQRVRLEASTVTAFAGEIATVAGQKHAHVHLVGLGLQPAKPPAHAVVVAVAVDDQAPLLLAEVLPGHGSRNLLLLTAVEQLAPLPLRGLDTPGFDRAIFERERWIGHDQIEVNVDGAAEPAAALAGTERAIEGEQVRHRLSVGDPTRSAL